MDSSRAAAADSGWDDVPTTGASDAGIGATATGSGDGRSGGAGESVAVARAGSIFRTAFCGRSSPMTVGVRSRLLLRLVACFRGGRDNGASTDGEGNTETGGVGSTATGAAAGRTCMI